MPRFTFRVSCAIIFLFGAAVALHGQTPIGDRPEVLKSKPLTRDELEKQKAAQLVRESQTIYGLGVMRHRADRWLEAVNLLEQAAKLDPDTPAVYRALIPIYMNLAREDDALNACRKVLERDPGDSETGYQLAKLQKADGKPREAIASLVQGVSSKRIEEHPGLLFFMLRELADLQEKAGDTSAAVVTYRRLAKHLIDKRAPLINAETMSKEEHALGTAFALERIGHCLLAEKSYTEAVKAFQEARDFLDKQPDAETRLKAVRLNWNLAQVYLSREDYGNALTYLDAYLDHRPADVEPYEKKVLVLRKLGRGRDVVPALKRYAGRMPDALALQLLYASEMARDQRTRREAEALYIALADRFSSPDIYRGLFKLYQLNNQMTEVLDFIDKVFETVRTKDDIPATDREKARERGRAMLQVFNNEPSLVSSLLDVALRDLNHERKPDTLQLLAGLAARAKQLEKAERLFRRCLPQVPQGLEASVYLGLLEVLRMEHKHEDIIAICREALYGARKAEATNAVLFHTSLAAALSEKERFDDALTEIDKGIKLAAEGDKVRRRCLRANILASAERYDAAVSECETMLKELTEANEIKTVRHTLSLVYTFKGDKEKSEAQLLKILEDDPTDPGANNDLGYHWAERNRNLDEAEKMIRKAIEVDRIQRRESPEEYQENAAYLDSLAWVLFRKGKLDEARELLEKAVKMYDGDDPTVWDHLGDVYLKLQQPKKAKEAYEVAVKLFGNSKQGKREGRLDETKRKLLKMLSE